MKKGIVCLITAALIVLAFYIYNYKNSDDIEKDIKVGYIYVGDASTPYTKNFIKAQKANEAEYADKITTCARYNISEGDEVEVIDELVAEGCNIIFGTSYGYEGSMKAAAEKYPDVEFCMATADNANVDTILPNYHSFMGHISEGRYLSGIVAGIKLQELIESGVIKENEALIGYVGAYPYAEVISGYTAFLLGAKVYCPSARMEVAYTNTWSDYSIENRYAKELIGRGAVIIAQHSDTIGPAIACEEHKGKKPVYHVGYNQSMIDVAPTTSLVACRINWEPYIKTAVYAVMTDKNIEASMSAGVSINDNDAGAGFSEGWVQMLDINEVAVAPGTAEKLAEYKEKLIKKSFYIYSGKYTGVDPFNPEDKINLASGAYRENEKLSAPTFHYVLDDVIKIVDLEEK